MQPQFAEPDPVECDVTAARLSQPEESGHEGGFAGPGAADNADLSDTIKLLILCGHWFIEAVQHISKLPGFLSYVTVRLDMPNMLYLYILYCTSVPQIYNADK